MGQFSRRPARAYSVLRKQCAQSLVDSLQSRCFTRIVVIGDLTRSWERFGPIIEAEVKAQVLPGGVPPTVVPAHEAGMARLRGTVALVLQKHFAASIDVPAGNTYFER